MFLHLTGTASTTPQALSRVLAQELWQDRGSQKGLGRGAWCPQPQPWPLGLLLACHTWEQSERACGEKCSEYSSGTSFTNRSTSSRLIFFFLCWKGDWPAIISYRRQPSAHQSGLNVYRSFFTTSGAGQGVMGVKAGQEAETKPWGPGNAQHTSSGASAQTSAHQAGTTSSLGGPQRRTPHAPSNVAL